jgi:hypothetical protein
MSDLNDEEGQDNETSPLDNQFKVGEYEIEVVDERAPEDQREPGTEAPNEDGDPTDEELQAVSARVRKRIDKLTFKINDERRGREAAERMQEEAIRFAQAQQTENGQLRTLMAEGENVLVSEVRERTKGAVVAAQQEYQAAVEEGDPARLGTAQMALNRAQIEEHEAESYTPSVPVQPGQTPTQTQPGPVEQAAQQLQAPAVDRDFESWKGRNEWFDTDLPKRSYAMAIHEEMQNNQNSSGVIVGSPAYYIEIDRRMSAVFPADAGSEGTSEPAATPAPTVVAPSSRQSAGSGSPRKVQLTETQVSLAKRLNIPLEVYARETLKLGDS